LTSPGGSDIALNENLVTIGWNELPDLSKIKTKDELEKLYWETHPDAKKMQAANEVDQIWRFMQEIKKGDLVALPLKKQSAIERIWGRATLIGCKYLE
jgi:restriction system protein